MMGLSKVTFNVGKDGLGRRIPNEDKVSGIVFYNNTPPTGWVTVNEQLVYTLGEAEDKGLTEASAGHEDEWYHISEYFRANPEGEIYIGYYPVPAGAYDFEEITSLANFAQGRIRQVGVYASVLTFDSGDVTLIQGIIDALGEGTKRMVALFAANWSAVVDWTAETDLRTLSAPNVATVIGQDGGAAGAALYVSTSHSITSLGNCLGNVSKSSVQQSIGWPRFFNSSNGVELEVPALANGDLVSAVSDALLGGLKDKGYTVLRKYDPHIAGTFYERQPGAVVATDDFAYIEYSRTMNKAIRNVNTVLVPELNSPLLLDPDTGTLSGDVVGYFQDLCKQPLDDMESDSEISGSDVLIDPDQNVLSTSTLVVTIKILPVGIAEFIEVNIGFTVEL